VVDVWCYSTKLRATEVPQVHIYSMWDRPKLERTSAFEARIARLAAAEGATGPTLKRWAQGCDAFPAGAGPRPNISSWDTPCVWVRPVMATRRHSHPSASARIHSRSASAPIWRHTADGMGGDGAICARLLAAKCLSWPRYQDQRSPPETSASHKRAMAAVSVASQSPASR
jgi:hypothetical protein